MKSLIIILFIRIMSYCSVSGVRRAGSAFAWISWPLMTRMKQTTITNLAICYPGLCEDKRTLLAKKSLQNTYQTISESGPVWLWNVNRVLAQVLDVEGLEFLQQAQGEGKGTVILAPHLGNWEVLGLYLNNCGLGQCSQLYQTPKDKRLNDLIYNARTRNGAKLVATDTKGVAQLLKSLKRGEMVGILPDQVPPESAGDYAPLYGKDVLTMTLVTRLIQKTGAKVVIGFAARINNGSKPGWKVIFRMPDEKIYAEHIQKSLNAMNTSIEKVVNEYPEQYQWEYKRYKRVPAGEERPY